MIGSPCGTLRNLLRLPLPILHDPNVLPSSYSVKLRENEEREKHPARRGKKFEFSNVEFDLQSANIKVRRVPPGNGKGQGLSQNGDMERREVPAAPRALAEALGIRLEFVRGVSSTVTSSQERRQFCFIAHGRESFSETLLQEVPSGRAALLLGDEVQRF